MVASISSPASLVNNALRRVGFKWSIGNLYDGSTAAKVALSMYAQTRDQLLYDNDWDFAERNVTGTLLKSAPAGGYFPPTVWNGAVNPPIPWTYEYLYASDMIRVRSIRQQPLNIIDFDPQWNVFTTENDNYFTPAQRVILCYVQNAFIVYTGQITDLSTWEMDAVETFASALGRRLAPALVGMEGLKLAVADESMESAQAKIGEG
jgi:hypothetical protein